MGGKQTITGDQIEFVGYGLQIPTANIDDYAKVDPKGKIVVWLGAQGPSTVGPESRRLLIARSRLATDKGATAVIAPAAGFAFGRGGGAALRRHRELPASLRRRHRRPACTAAPHVASRRPRRQVSAARRQPARGQQPGGGGGGGGRGGQVDSGDFTTVQRYDQPVPPAVTAQDEFFEFLFSGSDTNYAAAARRRRRSASRSRRSRSRTSRSRSTSTPTTTSSARGSPATSSASSRAATRS